VRTALVEVFVWDHQTWVPQIQRGPAAGCLRDPVAVGGGFVYPCLSAAMHAVRFAVTIMWPTAPHMPPPGYRQDSEGILELIAHWREAALEIGEFAPPPPTLRLVSDTAAPA
jgi:hypothetical protein